MNGRHGTSNRSARTRTHVAPLPVFMQEVQWNADVDATAFPEVATPAAAKPLANHVEVLARGAAAE